MQRKEIQTIEKMETNRKYRGITKEEILRLAPVLLKLKQYDKMMVDYDRESWEEHKKKSLMTLVPDDEYNITGRGKVFTIDLVKNNLPTLIDDFEKLLNQQVFINEKSYRVTGIERRGVGSKVHHSHIGLLVRELNQITTDDWT